jgi:hypothetical protein
MAALYHFCAASEVGLAGTGRGKTEGNEGNEEKLNPPKAGLRSLCRLLCHFPESSTKPSIAERFTAGVVGMGARNLFRFNTRCSGVHRQ